jgi:hypothetical protein
MAALPNFPNKSDTNQQMYDALAALRDYLNTLLGDDGTVTTAKTKLGLQNAVLTNTAQTISAKKTYSVLPESSVAPTTNNQLANKAYVDSKAKASFRLDGTTLYIRNDGTDA